jgi:hypothetical protein
MPLVKVSIKYFIFIVAHGCLGNCPPPLNALTEYEHPKIIPYSNEIQNVANYQPNRKHGINLDKRT